MAVNAQHRTQNERIDCVEKIAQWQKLKALVLDSVSSPITKRVYNMALNEFIARFQRAPRPGFRRTSFRLGRIVCGSRASSQVPVILVLERYPPPDA